MNGLALSDDRTLECAVFQKSDARSYIHAALDAGAGNDPIADGSVWIAKEYERVLDQNRQIHPAPLAGVLLVEIATISTRIRRFVALGRHRRDRAEIGVEWQRDAAAEPSTAAAHLGRDRHRLRKLTTQHPEIPEDGALPGPERGQLDEVDRDDIARLSATHHNRSGYRREGVSITSRRERRRHRADVL